MKSRDESQGFAIIGIIFIIVALLAVLGAAGWLVVSRQDSDKDDASSTQPLSIEPANEQQNNEVKYVTIAALGLKINDPDSRKLVIASAKIQSPFSDDSTEVTTITPSDYPSEFSQICDVPAYVRETDQADTNTVTIGNKYYIVGRTILGCGGSAEMSKYYDELNKYILENITAL